MVFHNIIQPPALLQSLFRPQPSPNYMYFYFHFSLANIRSCFWFVVVLKKSAPIAHNPRWTLTGNREPLLQSSICDVTNKLCCKRCKKFLLHPLPAFDLNITGTRCYLELSRWSWLQPLLTDCTSNWTRKHFFLVIPRVSLTQQSSVLQWSPNEERWWHHHRRVFPSTACWLARPTRSL